jgi:hypothetical protein
MKRLALLLPLLALAACRQNGASVQIQAICAATSTCTFSNSCGAVALGNPVLDPGLTDYLTLILQLENQLPDNANGNLGKLNTNDAHVDEGVVDYEGALSGSAVVPASGLVKATSTGLIFVDVIPATRGPALVAAPAFPLFSEVLATIRLRGYYDDGTRFETADFPVTVQVSSGTSAFPESAVATCPGACPHVGQWPAACP